MACKIAESSVSVQAVNWRSVELPRAPGQTSLVVSPQRPNPQQPGEEARARQQWEDGERTRQADLAQCRQVALQEGLRQGREEAAAEIKAAGDRLAQTLRDLLAMKQRMRNAAEADVVKLSLAIARRILHRELSMDPESIQGIVHAGLQKLQNREISRVRICPDAAAPVRAALERAGVAPAVSIISDPKMRTGEILFETALGDLDASVETQLKEIERGFADRLRLQ